jgi:regulatory protein SWI5
MPRALIEAKKLMSNEIVPNREGLPPHPSTIAHSDSTDLIMLPHQSINLPQGQHRRQKSIPTAFDNLKISSPARHATHHRGLSFDETMHCHGLPEPYQQDPTTNTNPRQMQHIISETQQRPMARPGQQRHNSDDGTLRSSKLSFPLEPSTGCFKTNLSEQQISDMSDDQIFELLTQKPAADRQHFLEPALSAGSLDGNGLTDSAVAGTTQDGGRGGGIEVPDSLESSRRSSVQYSTMVPERPYTPPTKINNCKILLPMHCFCRVAADSVEGSFSMTPDPTPYKNAQAQRTFQSASTHSSPTKKDPNLTIKASQSMQRGWSCQDALVDRSVYTGASRMPSPPGSAPLVRPTSFTLPDFPPSAFVDLSAMGLDFSSNPFDQPSSHCSPMSSALSPATSSFQASPEFNFLPNLGSSHARAADFALFPEPPLYASQSTVDFEGLSSPGKQTPHSRSQSTIGLDPGLATIDTGVSSEEVNAFISGPHEDQKWVCMYPECGKRFGRKENIKSHVQTHLGDRQFLCMHCNKRFVRQHDLKRHEKIHTGIKPYPCECGHSFARMDALTRHKQRNTCVGGIGGPEGVEKKETKRGRPRKHRPDTQERRDKASRTRQRVLEKKSGSSMSGSSVCSFSSPPPMPDNYDTDASAAFPSPPQMFVNYDTDASVAMSRDSSSSHYGTPPELDMSSSSPIAARFFDFEEIAESPQNVGKVESEQISRDLLNGLVLTQGETDLDQMILDFGTEGETLPSEVNNVQTSKRQSLLTNFDFTFVEENPFGLSDDLLPNREDLSWVLEGL